MQRTILSFVLAAAAVPAAVAVPPATIDSTFATGGYDTLFEGDTMRTLAHLPRSDGSSIAIIVYSGAPCPGTAECLAYAVYSERGAQLYAGPYDTSKNFTFVAAAAIDAQDRVVVAGSVDINGGPDHDFRLTRFGRLHEADVGFGIGGETEIAFDNGGDNRDIAHAVAIDPAGRVVVVGSTERNAPMDSDFAVARLRSDGELDGSFGDNARRIIPFDLGAEGFTDAATAVAISPDGKIVIGGTARDFGLGILRIGLVRLLDSGDNDMTWCEMSATCEYNVYPDIDRGRRTVFFGNDADHRTHTLTHLAVNAGGVVVIAGTQRGADDTTGFVQRFGADGNYEAETRINGGDTSVGATATLGAVLWVDPAAASSDVIVTGVFGEGEKLFLAQRLQDFLAPRADWGSSGPDNSAVIYCASNCFLTDPATDLVALSSLDRRGRLLVGGGGKTPSSTDPYSATVSRITNPLLLFYDGLED